MKKLVIIVSVLTMYSCVLPLSIGNKSVVDNENKTANHTNAVYAKNGKTMVAINYILPQRAEEFEMLTRTVILPAMKREDKEVFKSLKFLVQKSKTKMVI